MTRSLHRLAAAALLALLVSMAGMVVIAPIISLSFDNATAIETARGRLEDLRGRRLDAAALEARRRAVEAIPPEGAGLLIAGEAEAGARLEAHLRRIAGQHGAEIVALRPAPFATEEGVRAFRASLQLRVPDAAALGLLQALETGAPALVFETLVIRKQEGGAEASLRVDLTGNVRVYLEPPVKPEQRA